MVFVMLDNSADGPLDQPYQPYQPSNPFQHLEIPLDDSSDLLIWQDVFVQTRAVFNAPRPPPSPTLSTIFEVKEESDDSTPNMRRQFSRRLRAMSIDLNKEENRIRHSMGCKLKPVLSMDGGAPDPDLPQLVSLRTIERITDFELDRWLVYYASDAAHPDFVSPPRSRREKEDALAQCIGVTERQSAKKEEGLWL